MKRVMIIAAVVAVVAVLAKKRAQSQAEWHGMTEEQARARLAERLPRQMPDEAKTAVTDRIVDKMRDKGVIIDLTDEATAESNGTEPAEDATTTSS